MKTILALSILFSVIALPALGELTDADLNQIRLIIQEEIKPIKADIGTLKTDGAVVKSEVANLKETIDKGFENVETRIGNVETRFDSIEKDFDRQNNIIIACIGIPLAILALGATVWGILAQKRSGKDRALEKQIETLTEEIETLKQQRIVNL